MKTEDDLIEKNCHNCKYLRLKYTKSKILDVDTIPIFYCKYFKSIMKLNNPPCEGIDWEEEEI